MGSPHGQSGAADLVSFVILFIDATEILYVCDLLIFHLYLYALGSLNSPAVLSVCVSCADTR